VTAVATTLTWEQKAAALDTLGNIEIKMRRPGDWFCAQSGVSVADGHFLYGGCGNGATPQEAIEDLWRYLVDDLLANRYVAIGGMDITRRVRWNGFMWQDVTL
jgi:hypothetical protein